MLHFDVFARDLLVTIDPHLLCSEAKYLFYPSIVSFEHWTPIVDKLLFRNR